MNSFVNSYFKATRIKYPMIFLVVALSTIPAKASISIAKYRSGHIQYNDTAVNAIIKEVVSKRTAQVFHYQNLWSVFIIGKNLCLPGLQLELTFEKHAKQCYCLTVYYSSG